MSQSVNPREIVFDMLMTVERDAVPSHILVTQTLTKYRYLDKRDRALISRLFKGTLEYEIMLDYVIRQFSSVPFNKIKRPVRIILRMGIYQILQMDHIPDSAACNEAVKLAGRRGLKNLGGFINGVLRNVSRRRTEIVWPDREKEPAEYLSVRYSLPEWLTAMWLESYDFESIRQMGEAMLAEPPLTVRVRKLARVEPGRPENSSDGSMNTGAYPESENMDIYEIRSELEAMGIQVEGGQILPEALRLRGIDSPDGIPAFTDGRLAVQDESAMLAARAAGVKAHDHIIDVCAAPGGKSIHLADLLVGTGSVSTRDLTEAKISRIEENIRRTGIANITVKVQDATVFCQEDEETADIVMADLPCSGLGVMGRKPDIRRNMTPDKIHALAMLQRQILSVVWRYVKPGGVLIYSTCTVSKEENEENRQWFLDNFPFAAESMDSFVPDSLRNQDTACGWLQILPGEHDSDGFFIARFKRMETQE